MDANMFSVGAIHDPWIGPILRRVGPRQKSFVHYHVFIYMFRIGQCRLGFVGI